MAKNALSDVRYNSSNSTCGTTISSGCSSPTASVNSPTGTSPLTITCSASGGSGGSIAYKWYSGSSCSGTVLGTSSTLAVTSSGNYACKAYITGYETTCYTCDYGYATISSSCSSPTASVNSPSGTSPLTISCTASGGSGGTIAYKWYSGNSCSGTVLGTSSTLSVTASGNYACKAYITGYETTCYSCNYGYATITTSCTAPTTQSSNITFSSVGTSSMTVNWTNGSGSRRVVKINTLNSFTDPTNGTDPSGSSTYIGGQQVVYNGSGSSVTITGLSASTTYWFRIYDANCSGSSSLYITSLGTNNPKSQSTTGGTSTISGIINAPNIKDITGGLQNNTVSSTVKIYVAGSTTPLSTITNTSGSFSFSGLAGAFYDIEASQTIGGATFKTKETNIPVNSSNTVLKLSSLLIEQLYLFNDGLENFSCYLQDLGSTENLASYNLNSSTNFINTKKIITNTDDDDIEALARLAMAERMLLKYYDQAKTMGQEFVLSSDKFAETVFDFVEMFACNPSSNWWKSFIYEGLIGLTTWAVEIPIDNSSSPYKTNYLAVLDGVADGLKTKGLTLEISLNSIYHTQRPWIQPWYLRTMLRDVYINHTNQLPSVYTYLAQNGLYQGNIQNTETSNINLLNTSNIATAIAQGWADGLRNNPNWVEWLNILTTTAMSTSCGVNLYIDILGLGTNASKFGFLSASIYKSVKRTNDLVDEVNETASNSFNKSGNNSYNTFIAAMHSNRSQTSADAVASFELEYQNTMNDISGGNYSNLQIHLDSLTSLNSKLNKTIEEELNGIKASVPFSSVTDSMYVENLKYTIYGSPFTRFANILSLAYFAQNTNEIELRDSILVYTNSLYFADSIMLVELDEMASLMNGIACPAYLSIKNSDIPLSMDLNTIQQTHLTIKNYGSSLAQNVYVKISKDGIFQFSSDSIFIGDIDVNEEKNFTFNITSPLLADTICYYSITIFADSALTRPKGGAILSVDMNSGIKQINKMETNISIFPNPNEGLFTIEAENLVEANLKIEITDNLGRKVYEENIANHSNKFLHQIDLKDFLSGIYFLNLKSETFNHTYKVVKL